jgi:monoamine oxidase
MSHSPLFDRLTHILRAVRYCEQHNLSTDDGLAQLAHHSLERMTRRNLLLQMGRFTATGTIAGIASGHLHRAIAAPKPTDAKVAIVGAGLAGLACADELKRQGISATVYEANTRVGGRCFSLNGTFPGQVAERGGEFIDTLHKTMLGYAREFNLPLEDVNKQPGETFYFFNGQKYSEASVVQEFRAFVTAMREDLGSLSKQPTAESFTERDQQLDRTTLQAYLDSRAAGNLIKAVIKAAYIGEYGREIDEQSCLAFLLFIHADRRSKFRPFGIFSDERYHVVGGNDKITEGLYNRLKNQVQLGKRLVAARKDSAGKVELTFSGGTGSPSTTEKFDAVVFTIPFSTLRDVDLTGLQLPAEKQRAIANFVYGNNAKLMIGFTSRPWVGLGSDGSAYADLPFLRNIWETNPINATAQRAIITDYTGGQLASSLSQSRLQSDAQNFVGNLDQVFAGSAAAVRRANNQIVAHLEAWEPNPFAKGSYTCNAPGYFTTIANLEGKPVGNLFFAGEHASSFYEWQGFMEGSVTSGITAAQQLLAFLRGR